MQVNFLGRKRLDFVSNDGKTVRGEQLFFSYPEADVIGERADKLFIPDGFPLPEMTPGDTLEVSFNNRGKPEKIEVVSAKKTINLNGKKED